MPVQRPIYMDYHATTPVDPRVVDAMLPYFTTRFGNASSRQHTFGWQAEEGVDQARRHVAELIGASAKEIVFTSGATESNNLAIKGVADAYRAKGRHIVTCVTEHKAVLDTCRGLEHSGYTVTYLPVGEDGLIRLDELERAITGETILVTIMAANNEIGVVQPIAAIGALARSRGVLFHTDAVQAAGKIPFDVNQLNVDLASITAHKMYGPKGVGALFVRHQTPRLQLTPLIAGGGQERGLRPGTLNVPGIVGFGRAAEICGAEIATETPRVAGLRDRLHAQLRSRITGVSLNGSATERLPNNLNVSFADVDGQALQMGIDDVAVSSGSACTSASAEPSHVLKAIGLSDDRAHSSIRFGLGRWTTAEEVDYAAEKVAAVVSRLREMSSAFEPAGDVPTDWRT